jgi:ankyrin repeat protein
LQEESILIAYAYCFQIFSKGSCKGDYDSRRALHLAVSEGHKDIVEYLLRMGASTEKRDRLGMTQDVDSFDNIVGNRAIDDALREGHKDIEEILKKYSSTKVSSPRRPSRSTSKNKQPIMTRLGGKNASLESLPLLENLWKFLDIAAKGYVRR